MDETPVHADLSPSVQPLREEFNEVCSSAGKAISCSNDQLPKNPKWLGYDKKASHSIILLQAQLSQAIKL